MATCKAHADKRRLDQEIHNYQNDFYERSNGFRLPEVYLETIKCGGNEMPKLTVSLPVKNQEEIIFDVLESLSNCLSIPTEIVLIDDGSTDNSHDEISRWILQADRHDNLCVIYLRSQEDLFESTCEKLVLSLASGEALVSMQADIFLTDKSFFERALLALDSYPDIFALSGRLTSPMMDTRKSKPKKSVSRFLVNLPAKLLSRNRQARYLGVFESSAIQFGDVSTYPSTYMKFSKHQLCRVYLGEGIVRGPIVWRIKTMRVLGGHDDLAYFLGFDKFDLSLRAFEVLNMRVGYIPCSMYTLLWSGTSHKVRDTETQARLNSRIELASRKHGRLFEYFSYLEGGGSRIKFKREIRKINFQSMLQSQFKG